jgi:uncharacterized protein (TIGR02145 family)
MNKNFIYLPIIIMSNIILVNSCVKKEGCTAPNANNYETTAEIEDGTCSFYIEGGGLIDADSNVYKTVIIGNQEWMAENLKTTKYADGTPIPNVKNNSQWRLLKSGAFCNYDNSSLNEVTYGKLYNWYAVEDSSNLCPTGWHVPTDTEWYILTDFIKSSEYRNSEYLGVALKSTSGWESCCGDNLNGYDNYGFKGLPGGYRRLSNGKFLELGTYGGWWSSSVSDDFAIKRALSAGYLDVWRSKDFKYAGYSVRCIKD